MVLQGYGKTKERGRQLPSAPFIHNFNFSELRSSLRQLRDHP
jgi:hypothetical protein